MEIILPVAIVGLMLASVGWTLSLWNRRIRSSDPSVRPSLFEYRTHLAAARSSNHPRWTECPVFHCTAIDESTTWRACELCNWEVSPAASPAELAETQQHFMRYGCVNTPEEAAIWRAPPLSVEEIALRYSIAGLSSAVRPGEMTLPQWAELSEQHRAELSDLILRRLEGGEPALHDPA